jgi:hypothetical protein
VRSPACCSSQFPSKVPRWPHRSAFALADQGVARYVERFSPNTITAVLVGVAGLTFLLKAGGGLYWLIPASVASLLGGVVNAWLFLVRVTS